MAAERKPGSERGRPSIDWNAAFLFYAGLPASGRGYAAVAERFGVSARTVERHGRRERWRERARELEREAAEAAAARLVEERTARLTDLERLVEASLVGYAQKLREGEVRLSPADLPRLHKLLRELWAETPLASEQPLAEEPAGQQPDPLEHKRQVLQALLEAGLLERGERQREDDDPDHDPDRQKRDRAGSEEGDPVVGAGGSR